MSARRDDDAGDQMQAVIQEVIDVDFPPTHQPGDSPIALPLLSEERRIASLNDAAFEAEQFASALEQQSEQEQRSETVLYLAYGSNLCAETFKGRRGIKPLSNINVVVPEVSLTFDLPGFPYMEPCFANVRYRNTPPYRRTSDNGDLEKAPLLDGQRNSGYHKDRWKKGLVGVVYEVSKKDYATIIRTEGGGSSYQDIVVDCYPLPEASTVPDTPNTTAFRAHTLYSPGEAKRAAGETSTKTPRFHRPDPSYAQPSARYLKLLTDGADEHRLPLEYKKYLLDIRPFTITTTRQKLGKVAFVGFWAPLVFSVFGSERLFADKNGKAPKWLRTITTALFAAMWGSYDRVFKPLFGDGERTVGLDDDSHAKIMSEDNSAA